MITNIIQESTYTGWPTFCTSLIVTNRIPGISKKYGVENDNILRMMQYINVIFYFET